LARLAGLEGVALLMGARWNVNPGENMGKNLQIRQEYALSKLGQVISLPIVASQQHYLRITSNGSLVQMTINKKHVEYADYLKYLCNSITNDAR